MNRKRKYLVVITSLALSTAVFGFRWQDPFISLPAIALLVVLLLWTGREAPAIAIGVALLFLYPAAGTGWYYGRGALVASRITVMIADYGWPISTEVARGFTETPGLHFLALVISRLTSLAVLPQTSGQVLVGAILGIWCGGITLLITGILVKRYLRDEFQASDVPSFAFLLIPILSWTPFFQRRVIFARRTLAIALFVMLLYILYRFVSTPDSRYITLLLGIGMSIIFTHHLTAALTIVLLTLVIVWINRKKLLNYLRTNHELTQKSHPEFSSFLFIFIVLFTTWQFFATEGGLILLSIISTGSSLGAKLSTIFSFFGTTQISSTYPSVTRGWLVRYQEFFGIWIFLAVTGGLTTVSAVVISRNTLDNGWTKFSLLSGAAFGALTVGSWVTGIGSITRISTFFILVGAWTSPLGAWVMSCKYDISRMSILRVLLTILIVLGSLLVQPYVVGWGEPHYDEAVTNQRFPSTYYAGGEFIDYHTSRDRLIIGDENAEHVTIATSGRIAQNFPDPVLTGETPEGSIVMLFKYNDQYYFGGTTELGRFQIAPPKEKETSKASSIVYENGDVSIFV